MGLILRLLLDRRVPLGLKLLPLGALVYLVSPFDLLPDFIRPPLSLLDDLLILLLAVTLFVRLAPRSVVQEKKGGRSISSNGSGPNSNGGKVVEGSYRYLGVDEPEK